MKKENLKFHIYDVWPWFCWKLCSKCKKLFRRELGWAANTCHINGFGIPTFVCAVCVPTRERAQEYFDKREWAEKPIAPRGSTGASRPRFTVNTNTPLYRI